MRHVARLHAMAEADTEQEEYESLAEKQRLKAALHHAVGKVCGEVEGSGFSREVIATITEATFNQSQLLAWDIEAFAKHAKRTVVSADDVKLCCRRNNDLLEYMTGQIDKMKAEKEERKGEGRGGEEEGGEEREEGGAKRKRAGKKRKRQMDEDNPPVDID